ncbi:MAG: radical SAM protein [Thermoguttaceae bacterium]
MTFDEILYWLRETSPDKLQKLWKHAEKVRQEHVGDEVFLRGLVEISNQCRRQCLYCGIRAGHTELSRYQMLPSEILETAILAKRLGYSTLVIQAGEDMTLTAEKIAEMIRDIKKETGIIVTLSLGERPDSAYKLWREAGADRYLLRFETSNPALFHAIHPSLNFTSLNEANELDENRTQKVNESQKALRIAPNSFMERLSILDRLSNFGYEVGSGVLYGVPGQSWHDLARDILIFRDGVKPILESDLPDTFQREFLPEQSSSSLDMIGCGPFLLHPATPLGRLFASDPATGLLCSANWTDEQREFFESNDIPVLSPSEQILCDDDLPFKVIALSRILVPDANIPTTTAVATIDPVHGRMRGLSCGANVVMPNLTPTQYRQKYQIYPNKAASKETPTETHAVAIQQLSKLGRPVGLGSGSSRVRHL